MNTKNFGMDVGFRPIKLRQPATSNYIPEVLTFVKGETGERWRVLCQQAAMEQDPDKFMELIHEITRLLEEKGRRLRGQEHTGEPANIDRK
ncbi:MAG TPA: hypothetical protein VFO40_03955 [Chthoniobacterales bacterium]|nr:hypothetical protein [Chthoniobacterales bacterium]